MCVERAVCELLCMFAVEGLEEGWMCGRCGEGRGVGCADVGRFTGREVWAVGVCSRTDRMGLNKCIKSHVLSTSTVNKLFFTGNS